MDTTRDILIATMNLWKKNYRGIATLWSMQLSFQQPSYLERSLEDDVTPNVSPIIFPHSIPLFSVYRVAHST